MPHRNQGLKCKSRSPARYILLQTHKQELSLRFEVACAIEPDSPTWRVKVVDVVGSLKRSNYEMTTCKNPVWIETDRALFVMVILKEDKTQQQAKDLEA